MNGSAEHPMKMKRFQMESGPFDVAIGAPVVVMSKDELLKVYPVEEEDCHVCGDPLCTFEKHRMKI